MPALNGDLRQLIETDQKAARPLLQDIVARLPKSVEARTLLATSYLRSLEAAPALEHYRAAHLLEPGNLSIRHQMGLSAVAMGDFETALSIFRDALSLTPTEHSASMAALMLHRLGRVAEAVKAYSELLPKLKRDNTEALHILRGMTMLLRDAGAPLAADRFLSELIALYLQNPAQVASAVIERDNSIDYHEWTSIAYKTNLAHALTRSADKPWAPRFPVSFVLPEARAALLDYAKRETGALFIAKPHRGTGGQGITVTRDVTEVADRDDVVVQRYVERPYLVDGRKAHVRLYGLVTSLNPFRAYLYREGIVRFAPDPYDIDDSGLGNVHAHVTNTALHQGHPTLEISKNAAEENIGHIWTLSAYLERMKADGRDVEAVRAAMRELASGFLGVLTAEGLFARQAKAAPRRAFAFKLFGMDVLIDSDARPWLIEAQRKPALGGAAVVQRVNVQLCRTVFEMGCGYVFEDGLPAERIATLAKDRPALAQREAEIEIARRGLFEPLMPAGSTAPALQSP
jgi:tetratricopeptide (TPR) repeat protein